MNSTDSFTEHRFANTMVIRPVTGGNQVDTRGNQGETRGNLVETCQIHARISVETLYAFSKESASIYKEKLPVKKKKKKRNHMQGNNRHLQRILTVTH